MLCVPTARVVGDSEAELLVCGVKMANGGGCTDNGKKTIEGTGLPGRLI
jgi:Na+/H+-translocating membrane pyrophosphatase